jgi:hypothetical protein
VNDSDFQELPEHEPAWLRLERATAYRKRLLRAGYRPLPVNGKEPPIKGWQDIAATDKIIDSWATQYDEATNTGVLTRTTPTIDIDITNPDAAAAIETLAREHFEERGRIMVRFGKTPKRAILPRTEEPFKKIACRFTAPDGSEQKIEILAYGQQVVVSGIHPETQREYSWYGGEPVEIKRADLPLVSSDDMRAFLAGAADLLVREYGFVKTKDDSKRKANGGEQPRSNGAAGIREKAYAEAALEGCAAELAAAATGSRNDQLNKLAYRLGRMIAHGWVDRAAVEAALTEAMQANGYVDEDGAEAAAATLKSGLDAGEQDPHPDLADQTPAVAISETPQYPKRTLAEVHEIFHKWFGKEYDTDVIDAVMAAAAAERLAGDPLWLLVISGPGNTKTETVQSLSGAGAYVTSTIASPTRFAKQLAQMMRGGMALGMSHAEAKRLALRCARDSIPQLRLEIILDLASNSRSRSVDVSRRVTKPRRTVRRELEALHMLGLLRCDEERSVVDEDKDHLAIFAGRGQARPRYAAIHGASCALLNNSGTSVI